MSMTVTMSEAGLLELPEVVRRRFQLQGESRLELEVGPDSITLRPEKPGADPEVQIVRKGKLLVITGAPPVTSAQIASAII